MFQFFSTKYLLIIICLLLLFTRFYKITEIPPSVYWDEASIGYNAYSIVQTGKDEWGESFPIHFRAFGEFKLPIYIYTVAIFVKLFGLNEFSVRVPAVLFSLGIVIIIYFLAKKLTDSKNVGILSSFFITISPWYFIFSRTGYEATAGLLFYLLAIYLFLLITKNSWFLILSVSSFILSAYSYNSFRIITPLTIFILVLSNFKNTLFSVKQAKIFFILCLLLLILSMVPIYRLYVYDAGISRLQTVSALSPKSIIKNYLSHFSLSFLLSGDKNLRSQQAGFGQIYPFELILLSLGLLYIIERKSKYSIVLILLILMGPIPAAITKESPHALRAISLAPLLGILSVLGVFQLREMLKTKFIELCVVIIMLLFFANYFFNFITVYPIQSSQDWQYAYKRLFIDYRDQFTKYRKIIISDEHAQPYIFALFYLKYDPEKFQKDVVRNDVSNWGFSTVNKFDKFEFGKVAKLLETDNKNNSLIFASKKAEVTGKEPVSTINFLDGTVALWVYEL